MKWLKTYEELDYVTHKDVKYYVGDYVLIKNIDFELSKRYEMSAHFKCKIHRIGIVLVTFELFDSKDNDFLFIRLPENVIIRKLTEEEIKEYEDMRDTIDMADKYNI